MTDTGTRVAQLRFAALWRTAGWFFLALVMVAAVVPGSGRVGLPFADKVLHLAVFAFLTIWFAGSYRRSRYLPIAIGLLGFGILIEVVQSQVPMRTAEFGDFVADSVGIGIGLGLTVAGFRNWPLWIERWLGSHVNE